MTWQQFLVDDFVHDGKADIQTGPFGTQLSASEYVAAGVPVINVRNIGYGKLKADKLEYVSEETAERLSLHRLQTNDIVFGRKGAVDRHILVDENQDGWVQGSDCIRLRFHSDEISSAFISYTFLRPEHQQWMLTQSGNKATMASLNQDVIRRIGISLPPLDVQLKVVNILSAYDDLIENNRRRMAKLEEAARLLYREWFVRLRFPGHEHTRIVNGVPEGWSKPTLQAVCAPDNGIQTGPFGSQLHQSDYTETGVPVIMPKDILGFRIVTDSIAYIPEDLANSLGRHRLQLGDVVYGRRGDIGRRAFISSRQVGWFCGTGCLRLRPNSEVVDPRYFFDALGSPETAGTIAGRAKGATMPNLNASIMADVTILMPNYTLQQEYTKHVSHLSDMIECLALQNEKLRAARDLLLPRLMSGEIVV